MGSAVLGWLKVMDWCSCQEEAFVRWNFVGNFRGNEKPYITGLIQDVNFNE